MSNGIHFIFLIKPAKRRTPVLKYEGLLRHYYFRIYYYFMLPDANPLEVIRNGNLIIDFPIHNHGEIEQFAYELGGKKVGEYRRMLKVLKQEYVADVIGFRLIEDYQRHLVFALAASVLRSKPKVDLLRREILTKNQGYITLMANLAEEFYKDNHGRSTNWHNVVLRVGRAMRTLTGLHR